jgi:hypothetical protein
MEWLSLMAQRRASENEATNPGGSSKRIAYQHQRQTLIKN